MTNKRFVSLLAIMFLLFTAVFASSGCGGGSNSPIAGNQTQPDDSNPSPETNPESETSFTVTFDSNGGSAVQAQVVEAGKQASIPEKPDKENSFFMGWYQSNGFSFRFNFNTPILKDTTIYAKWWDNDDTTDTDGDGLPDSLEITYGTDPNNPDTDGDGLTDYEELNFLNYNPLVKDTDENGINDSDEDADNDGLTNIQETNYGTNITAFDTDHDGLTDYKEIITYGTDPLKYDTDEDGVDDGTEVAIGSNPLSKEDTFSTTFGSDMIADNPDAIDISVTMTTSAEGAGSLRIMPADYFVHPLINSNIPGYMAAYNLSADSSIISATITFTLGDTIEEINSNFQPRIYYFNEETGLLEEIVDQKVEGRKIIATVSHFSTYILLNKVAFDEVWSQDIRPPANSDNNQTELNLDIVFVIDYSASMEDNDKEQIFKELSKGFINKLRDGKDKAAIVKFIATSTILSNLTADKNVLNTAIDSITYDSGYNYNSGTNGSEGLYSALSILDSSMATYKYVLFITDGDDNRHSYTYDYIIQKAKGNNVIIYTIGMGSANETNLKKIASGTGGAYYKATASSSISDISTLDNVFTEIEQETIDMTTDSNDDGISDYYTNLLNDGKLLVSNHSNILAGVVNNTSDDWDGDGLKNGEEIKVVVNGSNVYVEMMSNPILLDTDADGYSDYEEVKITKTSPLKYNFIKSDMDWIIDDYSFPQGYRDYAGPLRKDILGGLVRLFAWDEKGQATKALIDYFHNYATSEEVLSRDAFAEEKQQFYRNMHDSIGLVSNILKLLNTFVDVGNSIGSDTYTHNAHDLKQIEDTSNEAFKIYESVCKAKQLDIESMNAVARANLISSTFTDAQKVLLLRSKHEAARDLANVVNDFIETLDDFEKKDSWMSRTGKVVQIIDIAMTLNKTLKDALVSFNKIELPCKWEWMKKMSTFNKNVSGLANGKGGKIAKGAITVVLGAADAAEKYFEVAETYGQIAANCYEYQKYLDLLRRIAENDDFDSYIRDGAAELATMFDDSGSPDWNKFQENLEAAQRNEVGLSVLKSVIDFGFETVGKTYPIIELAKVLYELSLSLLGINDSSETRITVQSYFAITYESKNLFYDAVNFADKYWESKTEGDGASKYAVQLAQSRIVGVSSMREYLISGKLTSELKNHLQHNKSRNEIDQEYTDVIRKVYEIAKKCKLELSKNLPFYEEYGE